MHFRYFPRKLHIFFSGGSGQSFYLYTVVKMNFSKIVSLKRDSGSLKNLNISAVLVWGIRNPHKCLCQKLFSWKCPFKLQQESITYYNGLEKLQKVDFQPFCFAIDTFLVRYFFLFSIQYRSIGSESLQYDIRYSDTF
jgi:hypothetical protein